MIQDQAHRLRRLTTGSDSSAAGDLLGKRIVLTGAKGGVGTTTLAIELAVALADYVPRVVLVDANASHGDVATYCQLQTNIGLDDVLRGGAGLPDGLVAGPQGILVLPKLVSGEASNHQLRQLDGHLDTLGHVFDAVIVDAGVSSAVAEATWGGADLVVIVTTPDPVAVIDAYALLKSLVGPCQRAPVSLLLNRVKETDMAEETAARLTLSCQRFLGLELRRLGQIQEDPASSRISAPREAVGVVMDHPRGNAVKLIARGLASSQLPNCDMNVSRSDGNTLRNQKVDKFDLTCGRLHPIKSLGLSRAFLP